MTKHCPLLLLVFLLPLCFLTGACRKISVYVPPQGAPTDFAQVFSAFWSGVNTNYVYWNIDTTQWDNMYKVYQPLFGGLDLQNPADVRRSVGYFREMTGGLTDCHFNISFSNPYIADSAVFPALDRKLQAPDFHSPYNYTHIDSAYFDKGFIAGTYTSQSGQLIYVQCATIAQKILYFSCNLFALQEACLSPDSNGVKSTVLYFFQCLDQLPQVIRELVIDLRNNPGGDQADLDFFMGHLVSTPLSFGYTRYKSGAGRLDYTPWIDAAIPAGEAAPALPIVVLADQYSASLAEMLTMAIHALPQGLFIGERTWGATSPMTLNSVYNDGPFSVPGFLNVEEASAQFMYKDGEIYENKGFPPDVAVPFNIGALQAGDDPILDKAIALAGP